MFIISYFYFIYNGAYLNSPVQIKFSFAQPEKYKCHIIHGDSARAKINLFNELRLIIHLLTYLHTLADP